MNVNVENTPRSASLNEEFHNNQCGSVNSAPLTPTGYVGVKLVTFPARPLNGGRFGLVAKRPTYLWSPKFNGWRTIIHTPTGMMFNRHGEELTISDEFTEALENLTRSSLEWLDCEALERRHDIGRGSLIVLDAIVPKLEAGKRYQLLLTQAQSLQWSILGIEHRPEANQICLCKQVAMSDASHSGKLILTDWWAWMQRVNKEWDAEFYEGFVAKRLDSVYPIQLRSPDAECSSWIKHRWAW
jgi:hypothetical protein